MTARLPADLLNRSAQESSRLLALSYLDQIEHAQGRLRDPQDSEALHAFRVGLRRLRSCIRASRPQLEGSVTKKMQQRLRKLTQATNAGRDTDVQLEWLRKQGQGLGADDLQGLSWLIGRLEGRKFETLDSATAQVGRPFVKAAAKLRPRLSTLRVEVGADHREKYPSFGQVAGNLIAQHAARLREDLDRLDEAGNVKQVHRTRISIKRLRYLLEPLARHVSRSRSLIRRLKEGQDLLGNLHDMHMVSKEIASSIAALAGSPPDRASGVQPGLRTLERLANEQAAAAFENFQALWGAERAQRFLARASELGRTLAEGVTEVSHGPAKLTLTTGRSAATPTNTREGRPTETSRSMILS
jgi:CHAD domain-containing protein